MKHVKEGKRMGRVRRGSGGLIFEGSAARLHPFPAGRAPLVEFETGEVLMIDEVNKAAKALPE